MAGFACGRRNRTKQDDEDLATFEAQLRESMAERALGVVGHQRDVLQGSLHRLLHAVSCVRRAGAGFFERERELLAREEARFIEWAKADFNLGRPSGAGGGRTQRDELEEAAAQENVAAIPSLAEAVAALHAHEDGAPSAPRLRQILLWFDELNAARGGNGFAPLPILDSEIEAWARISCRQPTWWEHAMLRRLDIAFRSVWAEYQADRDAKAKAEAQTKQRR